MAKTRNLYGGLVLILLAIAAVGVARADEKNVLRPFTTDGCSTFPNGVPYFADKLWLRCCIVHDAAYWKGGTVADRAAADDALFECVKQTSGSRWLADTIWAGVRAGGYPGLPTSSGWGKGWTIQRDYGPFTEEEKAQIAALEPMIPADISHMELEKRPLIRPRYTITGDHCLDVAIVQMQLKLQHGVEILDKQEVRYQTAEGTGLSLNIQTKSCAEPFRFEFLLLRPTACTDEMNELLARGRIRLQRWSGPKDCGKQ
jgi:hypothetical protein